MREIVSETWGLIKGVIIASVSLSVAGIAILIFCFGAFLATLYWPFYPYESLNSFVVETQKLYPFEVRFGSESSQKPEFDNFALIAGKMYCGAKLINQHIVLKNFISQSYESTEEQKLINTVAQNADKYLCPRAIQIASSK